MDAELLKIEEVKKLIPDRIKDSHKGTYGKVCLLGGAVEYSGAIRLSALAYSALKSGAGLSTVAVPRFLVPIVSQNILEVMIYPIESTDKEIIFSKENIDGLINKFDVLTIGMGLGRSEEASKIVNYIIENFTGKLVLDADALYIVSKNIDILNKSKARIILTPHMMEFKRLYDAYVGKSSESVGTMQCEPNHMGELCEHTCMGELREPSFEEFEKNSVEFAKTFVKNYNVTLLLKGPTTYVMSRDITDKLEICKNNHNYNIVNGVKNNVNTKSENLDAINIKISAIDRGTPGMATAGSGDVLSGILTGFLGYIDDEFDAARVSAYVNGLAGELAAKVEGEISMTSGNTIKQIANAIKIIKDPL